MNTTHDGVRKAAEEIFDEHINTRFEPNAHTTSQVAAIIAKHCPAPDAVNRELVEAVEDVLGYHKEMLAKNSTHYLPTTIVKLLRKALARAESAPTRPSLEGELAEAIRQLLDVDHQDLAGEEFGRCQDVLARYDARDKV